VDGGDEELHLVVDPADPSPGSLFTVEVLDDDGRRAVHGYIAILDGRENGAWQPLWVLSAAWGQSPKPSGRPWDGQVVFHPIGLVGPLHFELPAELVPGHYRLRVGVGRSSPTVELVVDEEPPETP
jgi:hypothetical protein